jgi:50S ribosomal subunit-associated GTPase HflX
MDLPDAEQNLKELHRRFPKVDVVPISAARGEGINQLETRLADELA